MNVVISIQYFEAIVSVSLYTSTVLFFFLLLWTSSTGFESSFRGTIPKPSVPLCVCVCVSATQAAYLPFCPCTPNTHTVILSHLFSLLHLSITMLLASEWWLHSSSSSLSLSLSLLSAHNYTGKKKCESDVLGD